MRWPTLTSVRGSVTVRPFDAYAQRVTDSQDAPADPGDGDWVAATEQARVLVERGPLIVGASLQAVLAGLALVFFALSVMQASLWTAVVSGIGFAITLIAWSRARQGGLEPALPSGEQTPMGILPPTQQRSLRSQLRGRTKPTQQSAELVGLLVQRQRDSARHLLISLAGFGITLLGGNLTDPKLSLAFIGAAVLVAAGAVIERRRWRRVDRVTEQVRAHR
jgi:hypothetical protein